MAFLKRAFEKWRDLRRAEVCIALMLLRYLYYRLHGKRILAHQKVRIRGLRNIHTRQLLEIGTRFAGFTDRHDRTLLHVEGKLIFEGKSYVGRGCRVEIGRDAIAQFGSAYLGPHSRLVIMNGLQAGARFNMSWNCEIVDSNFHPLHYQGREVKRDPCISFADDVWLGHNVKVMPGVRLAQGTVVAAHAVLTKPCAEERVLLGGFPAAILQRDVSFDMSRVQHNHSASA